MAGATRNDEIAIYADQAWIQKMLSEPHCSVARFVWRMGTSAAGVVRRYRRDHMGHSLVPDTTLRYLRSSRGFVLSNFRGQTRRFGLCAAKRELTQDCER